MTNGKNYSQTGCIDWLYYATTNSIYYIDEGTQGGETEQEVNANVALRNAAPDLLEALKEFALASQLINDKKAIINAFNKAKTAIRKAEGL